MNISKLIMGSVLIIASATAASATDMSKNWACSTNASAATTEAEKSAEVKSDNAASSALGAFSAAAQNCRDCTKITCEVAG
ncbi:hypothetical protein [Legionella feeleii]|uniref:Uncharacterized protein n=1 Tax=Legionella feeleii TaxID=453 RepID=A0A378IY62_9GAMM|nr:hypothetical protein [Legionella feeleii]STX39842.1 Uncharacterised protein [Legionella feeleii]